MCFCEKPMALDEAECDEMIAAAARAGVVLQIGFMRRFQPEFAEARARASRPASIGEPMVIKSLTRGPGLPPPWAWDLERSNGMLAEVNSHDFDCVRWLAGSDIVRVYAEAANLKGAARGVDAEDFYDNAVVTLRFDSDAIGTIDGTCPADYGYDARMEVVGSEGLLHDRRRPRPGAARGARPRRRRASRRCTARGPSASKRRTARRCARSSRRRLGRARRGHGGRRAGGGARGAGREPLLARARPMALGEVAV